MLAATTCPAWGGTRSGLKANLQRRLHGLLVAAAIARRDAVMEEDGQHDGQGGW